jgi:GNAT superfamily N-acetyltransferase
VVEQWWQELFGIHDGLWSSVTVQHPHGHLGDYEGWYVAWRDSGVHVSAPSTAEAGDVESLRHASAASLQEAAFWQTFADQRGLELIGPSTHFYLDDDPGLSDLVTTLRPEHMDALQDDVPPEQWVEGGMADDPSPELRFGVLRGGRAVAAAVLNDWRGKPGDVGVLVVPDARGRGLGTAVGRHAASYAVREHGIARWRAATTNLASMRIAEGLGFEAYATQLAIRSGSSAA